MVLPFLRRVLHPIAVIRERVLIQIGRGGVHRVSLGRFRASLSSPLMCRRFGCGIGLLGRWVGRGGGQGGGIGRSFYRGFLRRALQP